MSLNPTARFVVATMLLIGLLDIALLVFVIPETNNFPLFRLLILKDVTFLIIIIPLYFILQRSSQTRNDLTRQELFRKNPNPMLIIDAETRKLMDTNEAAIKTFGYSRQEFSEMRIEDLFSKDDNTKGTKNEDEQHYKVAGIKRILCKDGSVINVEFSHFSIFCKDQKAGLIISNSIIEPTGQKKYIDSEFVQQINDRIAELTLAKKELEVRNREINATNDELIILNNLLQSANKKLASQSASAIQEKTDQLKRICNLVNESIWSFDLKGDGCDFVNTSAVKFFGIPGEKIIDCPNFWIEFVHPLEKDLVFEKLKTLETQDEIELSYRMVDSRKDTKTFHQKISITRDQNGKAVRLDCIGWPV